MTFASTLVVAGLLFGGQGSQDTAARAQAFLTKVRGAVGSGNPATVAALFSRASDASYLHEMAVRAGGIGKLKVKVIPAPPGWGSDAYWIVFHTFQDIEQDHDVNCALARTPDGYLVGREIPEWETKGYRIRHARLDVRINPDSSSVGVRAGLELTSPSNASAAPVFRLNDVYRVGSATADGNEIPVVTATEDQVPRVRAGELLRAGGLLIHWQTRAAKILDVQYSGILKQGSTRQDKIAPHVAYVVSRWVPSMGQLPHTTATRIRAPKDWTMVSEGVEVDEGVAGFGPSGDLGDYHVKAFKCDLPISFPKVVAGKYTLAAELKDGGKTYRAYHLDPVEPERGRRDVEIMKNAIGFFEKNLGPWPFPGYAVYDGDTFYGIESYSYTLLQRRVTTTFTAHEAGHTYFGGVAPCTYLRDTWNEGMTQYVDSVLFSNNRDGTLQNGIRSMQHAVPLDKMFVPWAYGSASYWRGAYAMRMLEHEIGLDKVFAGLRAMLADRRGKDTVWGDLRAYFERASGTRLDWFWRQWIEQAVYPTIEVVEARKVQRDGKWTTWVTVRQRWETARAPFRLRFLAKVTRGQGATQSAQSVAVLTGSQDTFRVDSDFEPDSATVDVFGYALARTGQPVPVVR
jgi:aminopeptidase N